MGNQNELTSGAPNLISLTSELKRLAERLFARGLITEEGFEKVASDPEVIVEEG